MKIKRILNLADKLKNKSHILLGPRQTGKTVAIQEQLKNVKVYNLLLLEEYRRLSFDPTLIRKELKPDDQLVVIDEIQRLPELLNEVQYMIDHTATKFLLTGSSARKLKKQGNNLLGGRARLLRIHPFVRQELGDKFELNLVIQRGLLPSIYFSDDYRSDLEAYIGLYIEQEIANESAVRSLSTFSRFLQVASLCNAEEIDYSSIANDAQIPRTTIYEYFRILEDTLIGYMLPCWQETKKRKPINKSKFYFFDWGVTKTLQGFGEISMKSEMFGKAFESYMFHEIKSFCDYHKIKDLHFWRTTQKDEVDFIIDNKIAVEIKSSENFKDSFIKSLKRLKEEGMIEGFYLVYMGQDLHLENESWLNVLNYQTFLDQLYGGKILN